MRSARDGGTTGGTAAPSPRGRQRRGHLRGDLPRGVHRQVADDRDHRAIGGVVAAVEAQHVVALDRRHRFRRRHPAVRVPAVESGIEAADRRAARAGSRPRGGARRGARALALERRRRKRRPLQHCRKRRDAPGRARHSLDSVRSWRLARSRSIVPPEMRADVGMRRADLVLGQVGGAGVEQRVRQRGGPGFAGGS